MICKQSCTVMLAKPICSMVAAMMPTENRLVALALGQTGGCQSDDDRVVAGKHQIDHHDLKNAVRASGEKHLGHAGHSVKRPIRHHSSLELPEGPGLDVHD